MNLQKGAVKGVSDVLNETEKITIGAILDKLSERKAELEGKSDEEKAKLAKKHEDDKVRGEFIRSSSMKGRTRLVVGKGSEAMKEKETKEQEKEPETEKDKDTSSADKENTMLPQVRLFSLSRLFTFFR